MKSKCEHFENCEHKYFENSKGEKQKDCVLADVKNNCIIFKNFLNENGFFTTENRRDL